MAIAASFGGRFFDEAQNPLFNEEACVAALQWMTDSIYEEKITNPASIMWTETEVDGAMRAGDIAFGISWSLPNSINDPSRSKTAGQWKIGLMPSLDGKKPYTIVGSAAWAVSFGTKHKKEATDFIFFMADKEGAKIAALEQGITPGWSSLFEDPDLMAIIPQLEVMGEQSKYMVNRPIVPWYEEFSIMFAVEVNSALAQQKTPQQALNDAYQKTLEIKENYEALTKK